MELDVGFVCGRCDTYAPLDARKCSCCGAALGFATTDDAPGDAVAASPARVAPGERAALAALFGEQLPELPPVDDEALTVPPPPRVEPQKIFVGPIKIPARFVLSEALMDQARSYVCKKCYSPVPQGHKFCGRCGEPVPREVLTAQTLLLSKMLEPGKAKLVVIKGEGFQADPSDETAFLLGGKQHPAGRTQGDILFDRDNWVSPLHATFYYRDDGKLMIRDEASLNGVFLRIKGAATIQPGNTPSPTSPVAPNTATTLCRFASTSAAGGYSSPSGTDMTAAARPSATSASRTTPVRRRRRGADDTIPAPRPTAAVRPTASSSPCRP